MRRLFLILMPILFISGCFKVGSGVSVKSSVVLKSNDLPPPAQPLPSPAVTPRPTVTPTPTVMPPNLFTQAYKAMEVSGCFNCHGSGFAYGDLKGLTTEAGWLKTYVVAGKPDESFLIKKLRLSNLASGTMPPNGADLSSANYSLIRNWISNIPVAAPPIAPVGEDVFKIERNVVTIETFLDQMRKVYPVFGLEGTNRYAALASNWRMLWGGGCDFWKGSVSRLQGTQAVFDNPTHLCDNSSKHAGPVGINSVLKAGARINVCEYFSDSDLFFNSFFTSTGTSSATFNKASAEKAFKLYYPTMEFTDAIYNNFITVSDSTSSTLASNPKLRWRLYLSTLCQSMVWEIQ